MTASRKPRGTKWWALRIVGVLMILFMIAALSVWRTNPTIQFLFYAALGGMLFLTRAIQRSNRRAAGAGDEHPRGSEAAKLPTRGTRTVGIVLVLVGLALVAVAFLSRFWAILGIGLPGVILGIVFIRSSFDRAPSPGTERGEVPAPKAISRFDRFMRGAGIALVPLMLLSFAFLYLDAARGYHEAWPFYTFCAVGLVSLLVWPYLIGRAYIRWLSR